jgi:hypothetical protein
VIDAGKCIANVARAGTQCEIEDVSTSFVVEVNRERGGQPLDLRPVILPVLCLLFVPARDGGCLLSQLAALTLPKAELRSSIALMALSIAAIALSDGSMPIAYNASLRLSGSLTISRKSGSTSARPTTE